MAGYPISELKKAPESKGRDLFPIQQDGVTRQVELGILSNASKITASTSSGVITKEGSYVLQNNSAVINFTLNNAVGRTFSNNDYVDSASAAAGWIVKVINLSTRSHTVIAGSNSWTIAAGDVHEYYWTGSAWTFHNVVTESRLNNALANYDKNNQQIGKNTDLDNIKNQGWYFCPNNTTASTILHHPRTQKDSFGLRVVKTKQDASGNIQQIFYSEVGYVYNRTFNGSSWTEWVKLTTESDLNVKKEVGTALRNNGELLVPITQYKIALIDARPYNGGGLVVIATKVYTTIKYNVLINEDSNYIISTKLVNGELMLSIVNKNPQYDMKIWKIEF